MRDWMLDSFKYHVWANKKVLGHLENLPADVFTQKVNLGFASIAQIFGHLASAEEVWTARLRGEVPPPLTPRPFENVESAQTYMEKLHNSSLEFLHTIQDWEKIIQYNTTTGQAFQNSILEIVQQLVNHGTYHRGNITTILRSLGHPGTQTDFIAYARTK